MLTEGEEENLILHQAKKMKGEDTNRDRHYTNERLQRIRSTRGIETVWMNDCGIFMIIFREKEKSKSSHKHKKRKHRH